MAKREVHVSLQRNTGYVLHVTDIGPRRFLRVFANVWLGITHNIHYIPKLEEGANKFIFWIEDSAVEVAAVPIEPVQAAILSPPGSWGWVNCTS